MVAKPLASNAGVNESLPVASTVGGLAKSPGLLLFVMTNDTVWLPSPGPALMAVAQFESTTGPESSATNGSGPLVKLGALLGWLALLSPTEIVTLATFES